MKPRLFPYTMFMRSHYLALVVTGSTLVACLLVCIALYQNSSTTRQETVRNQGKQLISFMKALPADNVPLTGQLERYQRVLPEEFTANSNVAYLVLRDPTGKLAAETTKPGITRGNHFHLRKVERFMVLQGSAEINIRKLFTDEVVTYDLDGNAPSYVDIPTMYTHSITNTGDDELMTLFWSDEFFDPNNSDTTYEDVIL